MNYTKKQDKVQVPFRDGYPSTVFLDYSVLKGPVVDVYLNQSVSLTQNPLKYFYRARDSDAEAQALEGKGIVGVLDRAVDLAAGIFYLDCKPDSTIVASRITCGSQISIVSSLTNVLKMAIFAN